MNENNDCLKLNVDRNHMFLEVFNEPKLPSINRDNISSYLSEIESHQLPSTRCVTKEVTSAHNVKITKVIPVFVSPQTIADSNNDEIKRTVVAKSHTVRVNVGDFLKNIADDNTRDMWRRRINSIRERKRSLHLNDAFEALRLQIPALKRHKRLTSKLRILQGAIEYIQELRECLGLTDTDIFHVPFTYTQVAPQREVEITCNKPLPVVPQSTKKLDLIRAAFLQSCMQSTLDDSMCDI